MLSALAPRRPVRAGRGLFGCVVAGAMLAAAGPGLAQSQEKPPMNDFYQAFYTCTSGGAFMISYDDEAPTEAEMVTSNDNRHYQLKRTDSGKGWEFKGGGVRFWTDGKSVVVQGTKAAYSGCRTRAS